MWMYASASGNALHTKCVNFLHSEPPYIARVNIEA